jgi:hypothetical protein
MPVPPRIGKLGQVLVRAGVLDATQLKGVLHHIDQWGFRLGHAVVEMHLARESTVVEAFASATGIAKVELHVVLPEEAALRSLDAPFCEQRGVFPFAVRDGGRTLHLAVADPTDLETFDAITQRTKLRVKPFLAGESIIRKAVQRFYLKQQVSLEPEDEPPPVQELEEMKLVDIHGKTMMGIDSAVVKLKPTAGAELPPLASPPPPRSVSVSPASTAPPAAPEPPQSAPPTAALIARVAALETQLLAARQSLERSEALGRALAELLIEKGLATADQIRARMNRRG